MLFRKEPAPRRTDQERTLNTTALELPEPTQQESVTNERLLAAIVKGFGTTVFFGGESLTGMNGVNDGNEPKVSNSLPTFTSSPFFGFRPLPCRKRTFVSFSVNMGAF